MSISTDLPLPDGFSRITFPHEQGEMPGILSHGNAHAPDLVFMHANGFCASTYLPLIIRLQEKGLSVLAMDIRAQGRNRLPADFQMHGWQIMRDDLVALLQQFEQPPVLAGHSLGSTLSLLAIAKSPHLAKGVLAFDPPMLPPLLQWLMRVGIVRKANSVHPLVRGALARRNHFPSRENAISRYADRIPFSRWEDGYLSGYMMDGLRKSSGGGFELACTPKWEAQIYRSHAHDIWGALKQLSLPVEIITGDGRGTVVSPALLTQIQKRNPAINTRIIKGLSHFLPMENTNHSAQAIVEFHALCRNQA